MAYRWLGVFAVLLTLFFAAPVSSQTDVFLQHPADMIGQPMQKVYDRYGEPSLAHIDLGVPNWYYVYSGRSRPFRVLQRLDYWRDFYYKESNHNYLVFKMHPSKRVKTLEYHYSQNMNGVFPPYSLGDFLRGDQLRQRPDQWLPTKRLESIGGGWWILTLAGQQATAPLSGGRFDPSRIRLGNFTGSGAGYWVEIKVILQDYQISKSFNPSSGTFESSFSFDSYWQSTRVFRYRESVGGL